MGQYEGTPELSSHPPVKSSTVRGQRNEMRMIARAADILRALAATPSVGQSLGQIAKATGLPRSSVQRLVGALEAEGFVATSAEQVGVKLGRELLRLGAAVHSDVRMMFRPHMQQLHARTQDTVDLTMLMDGVPVVVDQITATASLRVVSFVGRPLPLHATASGKAHVMAMPREALMQLLSGALKAHTRNTVTSVEKLLALADTVSDGDFAYDHEEYEEGVCAIALPVQTLSLDNYALALSMPARRFQDRLPLLREALAQAKRAIEAAAGVT
jgi:IclR family transcriptional regulator, acetate operon repressor